MRRRPRPDPRAFTLAELLTVVGIVALLIAILLPALAKANARAREVQCAAILRGWGQAFHAYAALNHGKIPHSADRASNAYAFRDVDWPKAPQNNCGYTDLLPPLMNRRPWSSYPLGGRPTGDIWNCPLARPLPDEVYGGYAPSQTGYRTYAMNKYLDLDSGIGMPAGFKPYPSFLQLADARQSAVTLLMFETTLVPAAGYGQGGGAPQTCDFGQYANDTPRALGDRHPHQRGKLGGHLLMIDGHVEWTDRLWDASLPTPDVPPQTDRRWWPYSNN